MAKKSELDVMRAYIAEVDKFADLLREQQGEIKERQAATVAAKVIYDDAKAAWRDAKDVEHETVTCLLRFIKPGSPEILPLFDQMEKADVKVHGKNSADWRREPVVVLKLSALALRSLLDADIVLVGQLQDLILADRDNWWKEIEELTLGVAEAILAKLEAFTKERKAA